MIEVANLGPTAVFVVGLTVGLTMEPLIRCIFCSATVLRNAIRRGFLQRPTMTAPAMQNLAVVGGSLDAGAVKTLVQTGSMRHQCVIDCSATHPAQLRAGSDTEAVAEPTPKSLVHLVPSPRRDAAPAWPTAREAALALFDWLQSPGGLTGEVAAIEVEAIFAEMCGEFGWAVRPWAPVGNELRKILGGDKSYVWRGKKRVRVYRIPARISTDVTTPTVRRAA